jgi:hypothetical protein
MIARILPEWEWPRIAETGCRVDMRWQRTATAGAVVVVEQLSKLVALAFVFRTADDQNRVDGLWIAPEYRGRMTVLRPLHRVIKYALESLGDPCVPTEAAVWMTRPERRSDGVRL